MGGIVPFLPIDKISAVASFGVLPGYQRHFPLPCRPRYSSPMATTTNRKYRCMQCEMTEDRCDCEKYCCLCQSLMEVRLCEDGLYYCKPCREACGYIVSESGSSSNF
jgi:hypothetical protein